MQCFGTVGWASGRAKSADEVLERDANDLPMVQLMPLPPIICCFIKNPDWFNLSGAGDYPGCPGKEAVKQVS